MKRSYWFVVLLSLSILVFSMGTAMAEGARLGIVVPLTGPYGTYAEEMKRGAEIAAAEINATGGVLGKPVEIITRDSELNAGIALRRFKEMVQQDGIKTIGGTLSGGISTVVNEWACKNKVLYMTFCHTSFPLGKENCGYSFTTGIIPYMSGVAVAKYSFENLGKSWMNISADYRWGHDQLAAWMVTSDKMGGKFLGNIYTPLGTRDFSAYIPQIMAKKPDILVLSLFGTDLTSAIKQFAEMGLSKRLKIVCPKTAMAIAKECGAAYDENVYGAVTWYWTAQDYYPKARKFVDAYMKKYTTPPDADADSGYVATMALFEAMRKAGTVDDVDKLIETLEGQVWQYNKGPEGFRPCDHARTSSVFVVQGKGAKAEGWDVFKVISEVPYWQTLESCENNAKDYPYGQVKLPGK